MAILETLPVHSLRLALVVLCLSPAAGAQKKVTFDPAKHLEGYHTAYWGEERQFYEFAAFEAESTKVFTEEQLEEQRRLWKAEQERVATLMEAYASDPHVRFMTELHWRLEIHPFFNRIAYTLDESSKPIVFLVQEAGKDPEAHAERTPKFYRTWMQRVAACFEEEYVRHGDLTKREDHGTYVFAILASKGDYDNYIRAVRQRGLYATRAHYDARLRIAVTYDEPFSQRRGSEGERRRAAMHEMVHALQHAYNQGEDAPPSALWLAEGLANHISSHTTRAEAESDYVQRFDQECLRAVSQFARIPDERPRQACMFALSDLVAVTSYADLARRANACEAPYGLVMEAFYAEATMFVQFLHAGSGGRYRDDLYEFLATALKGESGPDAFLAAMAPTSLETLEAEFTEFLRRESTSRLTSTGFGGITLSPPLAVADEGVAVASEGTADPGTPPCAAMASALDAPELKLAHAVGAAARGRMGPALERLGPATEGDERLAVERERIERLSALQAAVLRRALDAEETVRIEWDGRSFTGRIASFDDEGLVLQTGRTETQDLPLEAVDPWFIVKSVAAEAPEEVDAAALAHAWMLVDDATLRNNVRGRLDPLLGDEGSVFLSHQPEYDGLLATAEACRRMVRIVEACREEADVDAEALVDDLQALLTMPEPPAFVTEFQGELEALARGGLAARFDRTASRSLDLHGDVVHLPDGRFRVSYDFGSSAQLRDFEADDDYLSGFHEDVRPLQSDPARFGADLDRGALVLRGMACRASTFRLAGPQSIEYDIVVRSAPVAEDAPVSYFVSICDDGFGSYIRSQNLSGNLQAFDKRTSHDEHAGSRSGQLFLDTAYRVRIECDEESVARLSIDGNVVAQVPAGARTAGRIVFWAHSDHPIAISGLTIEGRPDPAQLAEKRAAWVEAQLAGWRR